MTTCNPCTVGGGIQTYLCKNGKPVRIELLRIRTPLIAGIFAKMENRFGLNPKSDGRFGLKDWQADNDGASETDTKTMFRISVRYRVGFIGITTWRCHIPVYLKTLKTLRRILGHG